MAELPSHICECAKPMVKLEIVSIRWIRTVIMVIGTSFVIGSCGGSGHGAGGGAPFAVEMISCLEARGAGARKIEADEDLEVIAGRTAEGDGFFIFNLSDPSFSDLAVRQMKEEKWKAQLGGLMHTSEVNGGFTLVGTVGREGVDGGIPSPRSEALVTTCAVRPRI